MTCKTPRGEDFWVAGYEIATGKRTWLHINRNAWSVHLNTSPDGKLFAGDGGDSEMVAHAPDGKWLYLMRPRAIPDVAASFSTQPHVHLRSSSRCRQLAWYWSEPGMRSGVTLRSAPGCRLGTPAR